MKKFYQDQPLSFILIVAFIVRLVAVIFSQGYGMSDDHFLIIEVAQSWIDGRDDSQWLPGPTNPNAVATGHVLLYTGFHYYFFKLLALIGIVEPNSKMFIVRLFHALLSLIVVKYAYKITQKLSNDNDAKTVAWMCALLWFIPMLSVRNLVEVVCIPPLIYGTWLIVSNDKKTMLQFLLAGFIAGLAFSIRFQTSTFIAGLGLVVWFQHKFKSAFFYGIGVILSLFVFQASIDMIIWGKPFAEFIAYSQYNVDNAYNYIVGDWYNYLLLLGGILIPPVSLFLFYGFALSWRKHLILFLPAFLFFVFHSAFPNKQERFILPIVPFVVMAGVITFNQLKETNAFLLRNKKFVAGSWKFFWVFNTIVLIALTPSSTKLSRVEAMNYLSDKTDVNSFILESSNSGNVLMPRYYLQKWVPYYNVTKEEPADTLLANLKNTHDELPNYLVIGEAEKLVQRLAPCIKNFGKVQYLTTIDPSFLDKFMHWLNPYGNENQTYYIYKFER
ncbi:MAG: glycosyltransferase family 39 protein [Bacteroidota bacterium]